MKVLSVAAALLLAASAFAPIARAEGPRASSENNWPGMTSYTYPGVANPAPEQQAVVPQAAAPHYVWQEGYDPRGKWHGHWVLAD